MSAFKEERLMQVLLAPQISEKATYIADKNEQIVFRVASDATKPEVKAAVSCSSRLRSRLSRSRMSRARKSALAR